MHHASDLNISTRHDRIWMFNWVQPLIRLEPNQKSMLDHNQDNNLIFDYINQDRL